MKRYRSFLTILYIVVILINTVIGSNILSERILLEPFYEYRIGAWRDITLNILLFVPLGFLIGSPRAILCGLLLSALIETIQYLFVIGYYEFNDILNNTIGTTIGVGIFKLIHFSIKHRNKSAGK